MAWNVRYNDGELLLLAIMDMLDPQLYPRLINSIEVYTLEGHSDFVGGARDIFQKIKEDFGVSWKGKEICSKLYLKRVIQDVLLTRSLHFIKIVRTFIVTHSQPETS